jgi:nicotinamide-nucleotide amidase
MDKIMQAEIISIGDELLIGQTVNTNAAWLGAELSRLGFEVYRSTSIADRREEILKALEEASGRSKVILITGGLGPTSDDITKPVLCEFFDTKLVLNNEVLKMIAEMLQRRNFVMNENNRKQAEVPEKCRVLTNATGTAPGMWFEKKGSIFISMPGVPLEMKYIMTEHVLPELRTRFREQSIVHKNIMTYGLPEAKLAELLTEFEAGLPPFVKLAYLPSLGIIKLRLTAKGEERNLIESEIKKQTAKLYSSISHLIYGEDEESMEMAVGRLLKQKSATVSTAESCTGGNIAHMLTSVPGSSEYYRGSVIAYDNRIKVSQLKVEEETLLKYGAVSRETAVEMASGVRTLIGTDYSVAATGIAGPSGGSEGKPLGTVWISVASPKEIAAEKYVFGSDRMLNIKRASIAALNLLRKQIISR